MSLRSPAMRLVPISASFGSMRLPFVLVVLASTLLFGCTNSPEPASKEAVSNEQSQMLEQKWAIPTDRSAEDRARDHGECLSESEKADRGGMAGLYDYIGCMQDRGWATDSGN